MPEPVCQTFKGKFSSNFPLITSSDAFMMALGIPVIVFSKGIDRDSPIYSVSSIEDLLPAINKISQNNLDMEIKGDVLSTHLDKCFELLAL